MNEANNNPNPLGVKRWVKIGEEWVGRLTPTGGWARGTGSLDRGFRADGLTPIEHALLKRDGVDIPQDDEYEITTDASGKHGILHKRTNGFAPFLNRLGATVNLQRILSGSTRFSIYAWAEYQPKPERRYPVGLTRGEAEFILSALKGYESFFPYDGRCELREKIEQAITAVGGR